MAKEVSLLKPEFRVKVEELLKRLDSNPHTQDKYYVFETLRATETQEAYYAQGREPLSEVNEKRKIAGLYPLSHKENQKTITNTLMSKHIQGKAIDIVGKTDKGQPTWNMPNEFWETLAETAKSVGLDSGFYWKMKDFPHIELP